MYSWSEKNIELPVQSLALSMEATKIKHNTRTQFSANVNTRGGKNILKLITCFHHDTFDDSVWGEQTVQVHLSSPQLKVGAKDCPHRSRISPGKENVNESRIQYNRKRK